MRRAAPALLCVSLLAGCERQAPGPDECQAAAYRLLGVQSAADLQTERQRAEAELVIVTCLTEPWDKQLVACLENSAQPTLCHLEFKQRQKLAR